MSAQKVAVVTGSNKGIGYATVRGLCKQFKGDVYLTSRDVGRGQAAVEELKKEGLNPKFHQLDLDDNATIQKLAAFLQENYGGLDLLVNNAGIAYKDTSTAPFSEKAEVTMKTNFFGTLDVCDTLYPLLRPHARVVNVSSTSSQDALGELSAEKKQAVLAVKTISELKNLMNNFVNATKAGNHEQEGWSNCAYGMSKLGVTAMTIIHQADIDTAGKKDIVINACCPGYVETDMSSGDDHVTPDEGAECALDLALLPENCKEPRGKFLSEKKFSDWK